MCTVTAEVVKSRRHFKTLKQFTNMLLFLSVISLFFASVVGVPEKLPCSIKWVEISYGEIPSSAVPVSFDEEKFVGRLKSTSGSYIAGTIDKNSSTGYFASNNQAHYISQKYEVMTNPYKCLITWEVETTPLSPEVDAGSRTYIGRTSGREINQLVSGHLLSSGTLYISENDKSVPYTNFQVLSSYSEGLKLEVENFKFLEENEEFPSIELIGVDEIHNRANVEVKQMITHRTKFVETLIFKSESSWSKTKNVNVKVDLAIPIPISPDGTYVNLQIGIDVTYASEEGNEKSNTIVDQTEKEIISSREISVSPYSSVQACTLMTLKQDFEVQYEARDKFTAAGLSASEVNQILKSDGISNGQLDESQAAVFVKREGSLAGSIVATSRFLVLPFDSNTGSGGCDDIYKANAALKVAKSNRTMSKSDVRKLELKLLQLIHGKTVLD